MQLFGQLHLQIIDTDRAEKLLQAAKVNAKYLLIIHKTYLPPFYNDCAQEIHRQS
jgi:hypothetical protein